MPVTYSCASFALETTGVQKGKKKTINTGGGKKSTHRVLLVNSNATIY